MQTQAASVVGTTGNLVSVCSSSGCGCNEMLQELTIPGSKQPAQLDLSLITSTMVRASNNSITPGGNQSTRQQAATGHSDSGGPGQPRIQRKSEISGKLSSRTPTFIGTLNINTLIQPGKLHNLTTELDRQKILLLALQETRFTDENTTDYGNYRIFKSKTDKRVAKGAPLLGMAILVHKKIMNNIKEVIPVNNRLMTLRLQCANRKYTLVNVHSPTNIDNKKNLKEVDKFWAQLENTMGKIPKDDTTILLGDFNAQLGKEKEHRKTIGNYPAHKFTNINGRRLVDLCQQFNLKVMSTSLRKNSRKQKTWRSPIQELGEYQIDHVAISHTQQREIHDVQVRRGANIDSDHYLTRIKVKFTPRKFHPKQTNLQKFDTTYLQKSNIKDEWEKMEAKNWEEFKNKIIIKAQELIPLRIKKKHPWWNDYCENALITRKLAFHKYTSNKTPETLLNFLETRKNTAKIIRQTKRRHLHEQLEKLENDFRNYNTRDFYRTFANRIQGYTPQNLCFRKQDGKLALTNQENCTELALYFENLLNCPEPRERFPQIYPTHTNTDSPPPSRDEIFRHIQHLKNNKAAGDDSITAELLKNLGPKSLEELTNIIKEIWITEQIPCEWKCALIHPLHKKGDRADVNNYRGISLLPVTYKILSACLLKRTQEQLEHKIGEYQAGFRPNRSCPEQIFNLKTCLKYRALRHKPTICTFVDFKKAYDSVDRKSLFNILTELGLDSKTRKIIEQTLNNTYSSVKFMGERSERFEIKTGVRQGDGLSPLLFNLVLDKVIKEWEKELRKRNLWKPLKIGRKVEITCLAFADDLAILADEEHYAIQQIETLKECAEKVGLQISYEKTEFMCTLLNTTTLNTKYGRIKKVTQFKYLGEIIEPTGLEKKSQDTRIQKVKRAYGRTYHLYNKRCLSISAKIRHYNTVIKPEALYATETLSLHNKTLLQKLQKEERKIIRKILGPRKTVDGFRLQTNNTIEKISNITADIRKRRLKFYGHIHRLLDYRLTHQILSATENLKGMTWTEQIRRDLTEAQLTTQDTQNRNTYRRRIDKWEVQPEIKARKTGTKWTEERKKAMSEKMKTSWATRRKNHKRFT